MYSHNQDPTVSAGLVAEVTDDKTLGKMERKRLQIEHAPHTSRRARLVKLADKLYNLRDIERAVPEHWTPERVEDYFRWSARVVQGMRGTNTAMEEQLDVLFERHGVLEQIDPKADT